MNTPIQCMVQRTCYWRKSGMCVPWQSRNLSRRNLSKKKDIPGGKRARFRKNLLQTGERTTFNQNEQGVMSQISSESTCTSFTPLHDHNATTVQARDLLQSSRCNESSRHCKSASKSPRTSHEARFPQNHWAICQPMSNLTGLKLLDSFRRTT